MYNFTWKIARCLLVFTIALVLFEIAEPSSIAHAETNVISGSVSDVSGCENGGGGYYPYNSISFHVPTSGSYTFTHTGDNIVPQIIFYLYEGAYDPVAPWNPQPGLLAWAYSNGGTFTVSLTANTTYIMATAVNQGFGSLAACEGRATTNGGSYTINSSSPVILDGYAPPSSQPAPQVGMISISAEQAQPVYESAGGGVVRDADGNELWLPQDYDGNGFDTHLVMSSVEIDGRTWYEIWIGDVGSTVWVPADNVSVVE